MRDMLRAMTDRVGRIRERLDRSDLGSALLVVMGAAAILFVTAAAVIAVVMFQQTQQARAQAVVRATGLAQQGMEVYLSALRTDDQYWSKWPKITGTGTDGTWTVNADRTSKTLTAVGRERGSGVLHLIRVVLKQEESASDYTIVSGSPITLGNDEQTVDISGSVRSNAPITLAQRYDDVIFFNTSGGVVNAGDAHVIEKFSPADFTRPEKSLPNLLNAAKRGGSVTSSNLADRPLVFSKGRMSLWGPSTLDMSAINATGLVGVGIDLSRNTNASKGTFFVRSVWTPAVTPGSGSAPTPAQLIDFARQDPVWATGLSARPFARTEVTLKANGNNVIYVAGDLDVYVKGTFFSSVTIVSERDIYVIGPITRSAGTTATVGLVANRNIYICSAMPTSQNSAGTYQTRDSSSNNYSGQSYDRGSSGTDAFGEVMPNSGMTIEADMMAIKGAIIMDPVDPSVVPATPDRRAGTLTIKGSLIAMQGLKGGNFANVIGKDTNGALKGGFQHTVIGGKETTDTAPLFPQIGAGGVLTVLSWEEYTISEDPNTGPYAEVDGTGAAIATVDAAEQPVEPVPWAGDETTPTTEANVSTSELRGQTIITLGVSDVTGGVDLGADCVTWYQINGGTPVAGRTIVVPAIANDTTQTVTVTYWSEDGNGRTEDPKTLTFLLRGVDTIPAGTTVVNSWDKHTPKVLIPNGYPQVGQPDLRVYGNFVPEFTSVDSAAGLGVEQLWVSVDGLWQPMTGLSPVGELGASAQMTVVADPEGTWGFKTHRIEYFSIDKAGNLETTKTLTIQQHALDKTAPNTYTDMVVSPLTGLATYVGPAKITLTARDDDEGQGAKDTYYQIDGGGMVGGVWTAGAWNRNVNTTETLSLATTFTVAAPVFGAEPATHTITFYSRDRATIVGGAELPNVEEQRPLTFVVGPPLEDDKVPPHTTSDVKPSYIGPAIINLTATDAGGLDKVYWKLNGGTEQVGVRIDAPAPWSGIATNTIEFWAVDLAGNIEDHNFETFTISPERIAPITSAHNFDLYAGPATFELTAVDNEGGSGLAATYYKIDTGNYVLGVTMLGLTNVIVTGDGEHVVTFYSVDNAGNIEGPKTCVLRIDTTPPTTASDAVSTPYSGAAKINLTATDDGSGVGQTYWRKTADGVQQSSNPVLLGAGTWEVQYWSVDNAGNAEKPHTFNVTVVAAPDTSAPESYDDVKASYKAGTNPPAIIKLYSWDVQSGVDTMHWILDGVVQTPFPGVGSPPASYELAVSGEATHTLEYWAVDKQGNAEAKHTRTFRIDTIAPVTSSSARNNTNYWSNQEFSLTATDTGSGVKATYYSLDGGVATKSNKVYVAAPTDGFAHRHVLQFWSVDNAGNIEVAKTVSFTSNPLDDIAPTTYSDAASAYRGSAIISLTPRDNYGGSGVAWTKYRLNNGPETTGTIVNGVVAIPVVGSGAHTLEFWSSDVAGNVEMDHKKVTYVVDGLAPTTLSDARSLYKTPAVIHLTATDASDGSTVANTFYKLDTDPIVPGTPPITTINVNAAGAHTLLFWSVDGAGNVEATKTVSFKIDTTAPVTTSDAETEYFGNANIVLTANDEVGGSGVAYTWYKIDNNGAVSGTSVSVSGPASGAPVAHSVVFWSEDAAGNIEGQHTVSFTVAPMADITFSGMYPPENSTIAVRNPTVQVTGHANVSTVASATAKIDGVKKPVTLTYGGGYWVNQGYWVERYYVDGYWGTDGCNSWWVDGYWVERYYVDTTYWQAIDGTLATVSYPVTGLSNGQHWVAVTFTNAIGATKTKTWMFTVAAPADVTPPVTTSNAVATYYSTAATITLSAVDETGGTGVASTWYKVDTAAATAGTPPTSTVVVSTEGSHTVQFWSVDVAGNKEATKSVSFMVDKTPPTTTAGAAASFTGTATVYVSARDNVGGSGVDKTYYRVDTGASTLGVATPAPGVIGLWHLDEGTGATTADSSGSGFTGAVTIGASGTQATTALAWTNGTNGKFAKSLYFDGVDDFINLGSQAVLNNLGDSFSVAAWVKTSVMSGAHTIASRGNDWRLMKVGNTFMFEHHNATGNVVTAQSMNASVDWVHVVGTFDSSTGAVKLYLNGVLVDTRAQTGTTAKTQTRNQIGSDYADHSGTLSNDNFWTGQIDEVTLSNIARQAAEVSSYYAASAGGEAPPMPVNVTPPVSGPPVSHTINFWSLDKAGNQETTKTATFSVSMRADTTPPTTTSDAVASYTRPTNIILTAVDNVGGWGVAYTRYQLDTTTGVWATGTAAPTGGAGAHTLYYYSVDAAGNAEAIKSTIQFTVQADTTPPVTTSNATAGQNFSGVSTITLTATDVGWGVDKTYSRIDGGATTIGTSIITTAPIDLTPRPHTLEFWSIDLAGNKETTKSVSYTVLGTSAAMVFSAVTPVENSIIKNLSPTVSVTGKSPENILGATATLDGVGQAFAIAYGGGYWVDNGYWSYEWVDDGGCNTWQEWVWIPVTTWVTTDQTIATVWFPTAGLSNGPHTASVTYNLASGAQGRKTWSFTVDLAAPVTTSNAVPSYVGTATISLSASDGTGGSGVKWTKFRVDTGADTTGTVIVVAPPQYGSTTHTIYFWSCDNVDNVETPAKSYTFTQSANPDTTAPTTTASNLLTTYPAPATITLTAVDNVGGWGVAYTYYILDGVQTTSTVSTTLLATGGGGTHNLEYWSVDRANNIETPHKFASYTVAPDITPPTTTSNAQASYIGPASILLTAVDNVGGWGVRNTFYRLDDNATQTSTNIYVAPPANGGAVHHIDFWSDDKANNVETPKTATFTVSVAPPTIIWSAWTPGVNSANQGTVPTISVTGQAALNVTAATFTLNGNPMPAVLTYPGNTSTSTQVWVSSGYMTAGYWDGDGCSSWWVDGYWVDTSHWETVTTSATDYTKAKATVSTAGLLDGYYTAAFTYTVAGGGQASTSWGFWVDNVAPVTTSNVTSSYSVVANITLFASDTGGSGVAATYYTLDDGVLRSGNYISVSGPAAGIDTHHIDYYSVDRAGNTEVSKTATFTVTSAQAPMTWSNWTPAVSSTVASRSPSVSVRGVALSNITAATARIDGIGVSPTLTYASVTTTAQVWVTSGTWGYGTPYWIDGYWVEGHWEDDGCSSWWVDTYWQPGYMYTPWVYTDTSHFEITSSTVTNLKDATATFSTSNLSDGVHTVWFNYTVTGGAQAQTSWTFSVSGPDNIAPTTGSNVQPSYNGTATISLTATDNAGGVGVKNTFWKLDNGATTTGTVIVVYPPAWGAGASHTIQFWSVDNNNNTEVAKSATFIVNPMPDTIAPNTTSTVVPTYTGSATISLTASDNVGGWGMKATYYRVDSGTQNTYSAPFVVAGPTAFSQAHNLEFWSVDLANNNETPHKFANFTINATPDTTAPVTTHNGSNVYNAPSTITLVGTDNSGGWGIDYTKYRLDVNGVAGVLTTGTSIATGSQGSYVLNYWSRDKAGNQEATKTLAYVVDQTAPVTTSNAIGTYNAVANISLVATDNHVGRSGVQYTWYKVDASAYVLGTSISVPGPVSGAPVVHTISFYSQDFAVNTETPIKTATFTITGPADVTSPTTTSNRVPFYAGPSTITLTPVDNVGGWGIAGTFYKVDSGVATSGTAVPTGGTGAHTLEFWSTDLYGNIEIHKTTTYTVDTVPPTTTSNAVASYLGTATITLTAVDDPIGSGVKYTHYKVDGGTEQSGTVITVAPPLFGSAVHTITFWSVDNMNNTETPVKSATFTSNALADTWAPITTPTYQATFSKPGTITLSAVDIGWGVKTINYILDGHAAVVGYTTGTGGIMSASCQVGTGLGGAHTLEFWSTDQASPTNTETPHKSITYTVTPDTTPPVTTSNAQSFYTGPAPIVLTATDVGWGVQYTHYIIDNGVETSGTSFTVPETLTGSVSHTIYFYSVDWAGNKETTKTATFTVKATPLSMSSYTMTPLDGSTVTIANPLIRLVAKASTQNITAATMLVDGVLQAPTKTFSGVNATIALNATGLSNGVHNIDMTLTGADGRQAPILWSFTVTVQTDFEAPTTLSNAVASYFGTATVALVATDNAGGSGVAYTKYKVDSGTLTTGTLVNIAGPVSGAAVSHTLYFFSVDNAGNVEATKSATFSIAPKDVIAPTTTSNAQASYKTPDTILLSAADNQYGTGVAHTYFILDGGAQTEGTMIGTGGQGTHVLEFWSVDVAGNIETPHKFATYRVDVTAPTTISDAVANYTGAAEIHLSVADNPGGSGVKATYYIVDTLAQQSGTVIPVPAPPSSSAQHTIRFWSVDNAGNVEATKTATFNVAAPADATGPNTTSDVKASYPVPGLITFMATDAGWGVDKTYYKFDNGVQTELVPTAAGLTLRTGGVGNHTIEYWSVDKANNVETPHKTASYNVVAADTTPPLTISNAVASYVGSATITLSAVDTQTANAMLVTYYTVDGGATTTGTVIRVPGPRSGTAAHTITFWSIDLNGVVETPAKQANFTVAVQPASMTLGSETPAAGTTVYIRNPVISVAATHTQTIASVSFDLDGVPATPTTSTLSALRGSMSYSASALANGSHTAVAQFTDIFGASTTKTWTFTVAAPDDVTAPTTTSDALPIYKGAAVVKLFAADDAGGTGVASTYYKVDNGVTYTYLNPITVSSSGPHTIEFWSVDRAVPVSNTEYAHKTVSFNIDVTAPTTSSNAVGEYAGTAVINLTANDGVGSGIARTYFIVDSGAAQIGNVVSIPAPVILNSGQDPWQSHTLYFWSVDNAGNVEATKSVETNVWALTDTTKPITTSDALTTYSVPGVIRLTASDVGGWGVAATWYRLDGGAPVNATFVGTGGAGAHSLEFWSVDLANNTEVHHTITYTVSTNDTLAPVTTSNAAATYNGTAMISLTATDGVGGSGVRNTFYRVDGGSQTESTLIGVTAAGAHTIEFWSVDWAGNKETTKTASFTIVATDITPPVTTTNALPSYVGTATIVLTPTDAGGTGIRTTFYRVDGGAAQQGLSVVVAPPLSGAAIAHTIGFWSVDNAGNTEGEKTVSFTVAPAADVTAPTTSHNGVSSYTGPATITLTANDNAGGSGVKFTYYRVDGGAQQTGTSIVVAPPASGSAAHTIQYWSVDNANNPETAKSFSFTVTAVVVSGNATLSFRWYGSGNATLHVETMGGVYIAGTTVSGSGSNLCWDVTVPAGQAYRMVSDYWYDADSGGEGSGYYDTGVVTGGQVVPWYY